MMSHIIYYVLKSLTTYIIIHLLLTIGSLTNYYQSKLADFEKKIDRMNDEIERLEKMIDENKKVSDNQDLSERVKYLEDYIIELYHQLLSMEEKPDEIDI